jgi:hypothetical protein
VNFLRDSAENITVDGKRCNRLEEWGNGSRKDDNGRARLAWWKDSKASIAGAQRRPLMPFRRSKCFGFIGRYHGAR